MKYRLRDGTGTIDLKYIVEDTDRHGNVRTYVRRHGRKVRIRETPGTDAFMDAYHKATGNAPTASVKKITSQTGSLRWLVVCYYQSPEYSNLAESTRRVRKGILDGLCEDHGDRPAAGMAKRNVRALRNERAAFPEAANARVKALRQLFKWAIEYEHVQHNPARDVPYLKGKNRDGHHTWTIAEVQQFEERHPLGSKALLALALLLYTGVRRSDVVKLGPQMERDEGDGGKWLHFTITKGNKDHQIPILLSLREVLDVSPSGHLAYLVTEFGKPYTANGFGNWFRRRCDEAGLRHCSAHGLRKGGATIAAENGATEHELMAIYNWDSPKQAAAYTRKANRKRLVSRAMAKLTENESVPLSEVVSYGGTIRGKKPC